MFVGLDRILGLAIEEATCGLKLRVRGVDMLDASPVLDVKPYFSGIPVPDLRRGWVAEAEERARRG